MLLDDTNNPWAAKARSLDRYRWLLLRARYSLIGSALRFAREQTGDWLFGQRAKRRLAAAVMAEPCDFLLLQSAPKVIKFQRKKLLIEGLRSSGHTLVETALEEPRTILRLRMLKRPPCSVPTRYFGHAAYAEWLVEHHQPRILLNDRNGSLYAPFLRLSLNARQRLLVHLAHATTVEHSQRLGMNDYDYNFLFGQSSLEALQARELRFGNSTAVLVGSHMIDSAFDLPLAQAENRVMLILGIGPDKEKEPGYRRTYEMLRDWTAANPDYQVLIKMHPRSQGPFWQEAAAELDNLKVLAPTCGLAEALAQASLVVNIMSNAVIEAGLAGRPVLYCNLSKDRDIFGQERFFGSVVDSISALQARVAEVMDDYAGAASQARTFACFHLAHGVLGLPMNQQALTALLDGGDLSSSIEHHPLLATKNPMPHRSMRHVEHIAGSAEPNSQGGSSSRMLFFSLAKHQSLYFQRLLDETELRGKVIVPGRMPWPRPWQLPRILKCIDWAHLLEEKCQERRVKRKYEGVFFRLLLRLELAWVGLRALALVEREQPTTVIMWNGSHRYCQLLRSVLPVGCRTFFFENGLLPNTTTLDPQGVNFHNSVPREAEFYRRYQAPADAATAQTTLVPRKPRSTGVEPIELPEHFVFIPFQDDRDTQVRLFSPWVGNMCELFALGERLAAETGMIVVFKEHPSSRESYPQLHQRCHERLLFANGNSTQELIQSSEFVITLNSTVGLESLLLGKPVLTLGQAFFNIPGLVMHADSAAELMEIARIFPDWPLEACIREHFLSYMAAEYCVQGDWKNADQAQLQRAAARIIRQER